MAAGMGDAKATAAFSAYAIGDTKQDGGTPHGDVISRPSRTISWRMTIVSLRNRGLSGF